MPFSIGEKNLFNLVLKFYFFDFVFLSLRMNYFN